MISAQAIAVFGLLALLAGCSGGVTYRDVSLASRGESLASRMTYGITKPSTWLSGILLGQEAAGRLFGSGEPTLRR